MDDLNSSYQKCPVYETLYPFWVTVAFTMGCICQAANKLLVVSKEPILEVFHWSAEYFQEDSVVIRDETWALINQPATGNATG